MGVDDNGGPGVDFVNVQDAVDAAADGDVIEVRIGNYPGFTIDGKELVVRAERFISFVRCAAPVIVTNVAATQRVELSGLTFDAGPAPMCLALLRNAGSVRVVDCVVQGTVLDSPPSCDAPVMREGVNASDSLDVTLVRTGIVGGGFFYGYDCGIDGSTGLVAHRSALVLIDSLVVGGAGGFASPGMPGGDAGNGVILGGGSTMLAHRSTLRNANGGFAGCHPTCSGTTCLPGTLGQRCPQGKYGEAVIVLDGSSLSWKDSMIGTVVPPDAAHEVAIAPLCVGTHVECPCGNHGASTAGCEHAFGLGGARLDGVGNASVAADTVTLQVTGLAPSASPTAILLQGTTSGAGVPFDDGLLCVGGALLHVAARAASNGEARFGFGVSGGASVSAAGQVPPTGGTRSYQVWYRNEDASWCTPQRSNLSNGVEIAWAP